MRALLVACRYLTLLPLPRTGEADDLGRVAGWFPVVGLLLGATLAAAGLAADRVVPPLVAGVLLVALWALLTGGLHLDGLADALDGLGGGFTREETLAIMRDTGTGAYGVTAIALVLAAKIAALASLPPALRWRALLVAPVVARLGPLVLARLCPPARAEGAGHAFTLSIGRAAVGAAAVVSLVVAGGVAGLGGLLAVAAVVLASAAFAGYLRARLGGLTGDCLGALVEIGEAGVLVLLAGLAHQGRF